MPKERTNPNLPPVMKTKMSELSTWDIKLDPTKIPYVSHVPGSPIKMTESRKKRIRKIIRLKNEGLAPEEIAAELGIDTQIVKRDLTTAVVLANQNLPFMPPEDRALIKSAVTTYTDEAKTLMVKIKGIITKLEEAKMHLEPKALGGFAMMIGELRQTLELGAKLTGELQTGTKVNVVVFSGMLKRIIEILHEEVDRPTFIRIRDRMKLEFTGKQPLGDKGGEVVIDTGE